MKKQVFGVVVAFQGLAILACQTAGAWEHHPLFSEPVVSTMTEVTGAPLAVATPLDTFLLAVEADLVTLLADEESWARANMSSYAACPDALAFQATGNASDIRDRFFKAIRVNPNIETPLYRSPLAAGGAKAEKSLIPSEVSILSDTSNLSIFDFQELTDGAAVSPLEILAAASNEPDYGMDIGLFTDNGTEFGAYYGFGAQPFGNPGLDYGSQAPFHMGFYHESWIVYLFASFLKDSYPEYRIHLFKSLSEFAFEHDQDYWGWRFMGWGLHYLGDLSMPYHTTALPGYSAFRMILINLLDMLGWSTPKDNAVQLSSNRHVALETFEGIILEEATRANNTADTTLAALLEARTIPAYSDSVPSGALSKASHDMVSELDKAIAKYMPEEFVSDPSVELGDVPERYQIIDMMEAEHGVSAVTAIETLQAEAMTSFALYGRSYVQAIVDPSKTCGASGDLGSGRYSGLADLLTLLIDRLRNSR